MSEGEDVDRIRRLDVDDRDKVGTIQAIVSDYERDKLRPYADVVVRFALVLGVSTDELLGVHVIKKAKGAAANRRFLRRLDSVDALPKRDQDALLRTIDAFLARGKAS